MSHDQPTNQLTAQPLCYLSLRLKINHDSTPLIKKKLVFDVPDYCIYLHSTSGQHYHICFPGYGAADAERIRKRVKDNFRLTGNGGYSLKSYDNGLSSFVFYSGHEGSTPLYETELWKEIIDATKVYYVKQTGQSMLPLPKGTKKDADADWQLTYANFVSKALNHARQNALTGGLKETLAHLCENTKWRPSYHMVKNGVPEHYYHDYEFRSGKRQKFSMEWMTPKHF